MATGILYWPDDSDITGGTLVLAIHFPVDIIQQSVLPVNTCRAILSSAVDVPWQQLVAVLISLKPSFYNAIETQWTPFASNSVLSPLPKDLEIQFPPEAIDQSNKWCVLIGFLLPVEFGSTAVKDIVATFLQRTLPSPVTVNVSVIDDVGTSFSGASPMTSAGEYIQARGYGNAAANIALVPFGSFSNRIGSVLYSSCEAGFITDAVGSVACTPCGPGMYAVATDECALCPAGTFANSTGSVACTPCPAGTHADMAGSAECTPCAEGTFSEAGSTSADACVYVLATTIETPILPHMHPSIALATSACVSPAALIASIACSLFLLLALIVLSLPYRKGVFHRYRQHTLQQRDNPF